MALCLKYLVALNRAKLTDRAVHGTDEIRLGKWSRAVTQRPRKKFIEALITGDIRIRRLGHVDLIARHKPANQARGQMPRLGTRNFAREDGERLFGEEVLREYGRAVGHGDTMKKIIPYYKVGQ